MKPAPLTSAQRAAESAARHSYGRLLAYLARTWRDVHAAEDALGDAFAKALEVWPRDGVPANPDAWLLVASRNRLRDGARADKARGETLSSLLVLARGVSSASPTIVDKRLELMFVCAHPAISADAHTPLMLQTVLGLSAERIASCFLVSPDAMGRRLSRAKARIRDTGLTFGLPDPDDLPSRMESVLQAVYAAYGQGWDSIATDDITHKGLAEEALWLARVLVDIKPDDAEANGLLALMLFCEARSRARRVGGVYIPFAEQDMARWDGSMLAAAETRLHAAGALGKPGRFQLEAAIQSALVQSRLTGADLRKSLSALYATLASCAPTVGNLVGWAASVAEADGPEAGLQVLAELPPARTNSYQPFWALRADLLRRAGASRDLTAAAYARAIGLSEDEAIRAYLMAKSTL